MNYGICKCGKWGEVPQGFDEMRHFLKCPNCRQLMFLHKQHHPREAGYSERNKVNLLFVSQDQS